MRVTFCGHAYYNYTEETEKKLRKAIIECINKGAKEFWLGGYGWFDELAAKVVKGLKTEYPEIVSIYVTPYLNFRFNRELYDESIYPPIEKTPLKFAIIKRNEYMVKSCDVLIAFVCADTGGAFRMMSQAKKSGKRIINLAE